MAVRVERETRLRVPIRTLDGIVCFGQVSCSPFLMGCAASMVWDFRFLSEHGRFLARVRVRFPGTYCCGDSSTV